MYLSTSDVIAVTIALAGFILVIVLGGIEHGRLMQQNKNLRKVIKIMQSQKKESQ